jgi:non-ribosomal peptide synthetase component F
MTTLLQDWLARQAELRPDAAAVIAHGERMTYGELDARSNQLARLLEDIGCCRGDRVSVLMPKSPRAIVALLGIYKADCIFVPLDRASPATRLGKILASTESRCLLAAGPVVDVVNDLGHAGPAGEGLSIGWLGDRLSVPSSAASAQSS